MKGDKVKMFLISIIESNKYQIKRTLYPKKLLIIYMQQK